jgi:hypothetical protein
VPAFTARSLNVRSTSQSDDFGPIRESDKAERREAIAELHFEARARGESSLIVAPTHEECRAIAEAVRERERREGLLGSADRTLRDSPRLI